MSDFLARIKQKRHQYNALEEKLEECPILPETNPQIDDSASNTQSHESTWPWKVSTFVVVLPLILSNAYTVTNQMFNAKYLPLNIGSATELGK